MLAICGLMTSSCASKKLTIDKAYTSEINDYRQKTEEGLIIGERAPLAKDDLSDLIYFPLDETYKVIADVQLSEGEQPFELPTYSGITKTFIKYASLSFTILDKPYSLNLYRNLETIRIPQYRHYLFLPYKDVTNGDSTYGGGRYINIFTTDIEDGKVELDFNKSYNPWCAYSDGYNCPIPPTENHLEIAIMAGEKNFGGKRKT